MLGQGSVGTGTAGSHRRLYQSSCQLWLPLQGLDDLVKNLKVLNCFFISYFEQHLQTAKSS